jgi:hypothetical protein
VRFVPTTLPATFTVGANTKLWRGGGHLTVSPGAIVLEAGPLLRRATSVPRVVHTEPKVKLIRTRLAPPWINTSLVLHGEGESGVASTWFGARRRLCDALRSAGFAVEEEATWFSMGGGLARRRST